MEVVLIDDAAYQSLGAEHRPSTAARDQHLSGLSLLDDGLVGLVFFIIYSSPR
jgi:hypothetical protein